MTTTSPSPLISSAHTATGGFAREDFEMLDFIGEGAYGKVLKVVEKKSKQILAMKIVPKKLVLKKNDSSYIREERDIMSSLDFPYIVSLICTFQTDTKLYFVMEYAEGGELFSFLETSGLFLEPVAAFYLAEMILAIEYLHSFNIIHRDLKPENVLLNIDGHIRLTDFGLAKRSHSDSLNDSDNVKTLCGTDLYMAPEMILRNGYSKAVDWWSLGALNYEMLTGDAPFYDNDTQKLYKLILKKDPRFPKFLSAEAVDVTNGLMNKNASKRLGNVSSDMFNIGGVQQLKNSSWFSRQDINIDFIKLRNVEISPPIKPVKKNKNNNSNNIVESKEEMKEEKKRKNVILEETSKQKSTDEFNHKDFHGFTFVKKSFLEALLQTEAVAHVKSERHFDRKKHDTSDSVEFVDNFDDIAPVTVELESTYSVPSITKPDENNIPASKSFDFARSVNFTSAQDRQTADKEILERLSSFTIKTKHR